MDTGSIEAWAYLGACLAVPAVWGIVSAWLFGKFDRRKKNAAEEAARRPPVDYSI